MERGNPLNRIRRNSSVVYRLESIGLPEEALLPVNRVIEIGKTGGDLMGFSCPAEAKTRKWNDGHHHSLPDCGELKRRGPREESQRLPEGGLGPMGHPDKYSRRFGANPLPASDVKTRPKKSKDWTTAKKPPKSKG